MTQPLRRRVTAASVSLLMAVFMGAAVCGSPAAAASGDDTPRIAALPRIVYDAHRGGGMEARENSLSGLQHAFDTGVVDVLDLDTRVLRDGTVVLMHDRTVDRASTTTGPVADFTASTWGQVRLDLGSWLNPPPPPEPAPTLAQVLDRFGGRIVMTAEVKDLAAVGTVADMVKSRGLAASVYINSNDPAIAGRVHSLGLKSHLWRSARQMRTDDPADFAGHVDLLDADIDADPADFARFVGSGVAPVWAHTVTTRAERDRALDQGATGIITDDPRYLTGQTDRYPLVPTRIRILQPPATTQVSDRATALVEVTGESGPGIPQLRPSVTGRSVTATSTPSTAAGVSSLLLDTVGAPAGADPVSVQVAAGSAGERRWDGGSRELRLPLAHEDLQLRASAATDGRRVRFRLRLLDSAASRYTGPRHETGRGATLAGLTRAGLRLTVRHAGRVVHRVHLVGRDTGADDGDSTMRHGWTAPRPGTYKVKVVQHGTTYAKVSVAQRFRVR